MKILNVSIQLPRKPNLIANAAVMLESGGATIKISDFRLLRNKQGILWVAPPTYSVQQGKAWEYFPCVEPDSALGKRINEAILAAYEAQQAGVRL